MLSVLILLNRFSPVIPETVAHMKAHDPVNIMHRASWLNAVMYPRSASHPLNILHGISTQPAAVNNATITALLTSTNIGKVDCD